MAKYRMQEMPDMRQTGERKLYPRMEMEGQISTDDLAESISEGSSFTTGDVKGMIAALARQLAFGMRNGMSVKIDGIGIFSASLALDDNQVSDSCPPACPRARGGRQSCQNAKARGSAPPRSERAR